MNITYLSKLIWGLLILITILCVIYFLITIFVRHKGYRDRDIALCNEYKTLPKPIKNAYISLVNRRFDSIQNYYIFQIVNKVFGFVGVLYSVFSFGLSVIDFPQNTNVSDIKLLSMGVSLVSIISVIIALYLSPTKRVVEYINAWRIYDKKVNEMSGQLSTYAKIDITDTRATNIVNEISGFITKAKSLNNHNTVASVTCDISETIFTIESSITSDCE